MKIAPQFFAAFVVAVMLFGCTSLRYSENLSDYQSRIATLQSELRLDSNNVDALVELGEIHFQARLYPQAESYLQKAYGLGVKDPKLLFYYGLTLEEGDSLGQDRALNLYANYAEVPLTSPYRELLEGRYLVTRRAVAYREVRDAIMKEPELSEKDILPNTVAVYPLDYRGTDTAYATLRTGLAELMIRDLSQVNALTLVERVRIDALLQELEFGQSEFVDPATAPRLGLLMRAGSIVTGYYDVPEQQSLSIDAVHYDVTSKRFPQTRNRKDALDNLFAMEKDIVIDVIAQMGIEPTPVELRKIAERPTRNLQAFLLFSQGLESGSAGDYRRAARNFEESIKLDANFTLAREELRKVEAQAVASTEEIVLMAAHEFDPPVPSDGRRLVVQRLRKLEAGIQSESSPGEDNREPPEEAARAGAAVGDLPEPPGVPPRP